MSLAYLCLGSNLGDRKEYLSRALRLLARKVTLSRLSAIYETEPVGYKEQPLFLNCVCEVSTELGPGELLELAKQIEVELGRRPDFPNAPRAIDIDILLYDRQIMATPELTIPHPRLKERAFVLIPLAEIAPDLNLPDSQETIAGLASSVTHNGVALWGEVDITLV